METVRIAGDVVSEISKHLCANYPNEGCGVLLSEKSGDRLKIVRAVPIANVAHDRLADRFLMDPLEYAKAEHDAANQNLVIAGFFHSHPDAAPMPSKTDLEAATGLFEFARTRYVYAIQKVTASGAGELRFWQLSEDCLSFTELASEPLRPEAGRRCL